VANKSSARYSHPDPEVQGSDLEHIDEITMRAKLPTTKLAAVCSRRCSSLQLSMIILIPTFYPVDSPCTKEMRAKQGRSESHLLMISEKSGR